MMKRTVEQCYERLGHAGNGSVYLARNRETREPVAVKQFVKRTRGGHMEQLARREERILRACQGSEHVVRLLELLDSSTVSANGEGVVCLVLEQAQHDLRGLIENKDISSRWTRSHVKGYCWQLLSAVAWVHHCGFIHRDLKPANVLVGRDNVLKLADFGLAVPVRGDEAERPGHFQNPVATCWYRAPEVLLGARDYGTPIDVWAAGCIVGDLLQNAVFFPGISDEDQLRCIYALCGGGATNVVRDFQRALVRDNQLVARKRFFTPMSVALLDALLVLDPAARLGAAEALSHGYFDAAQDGGIEVMAARDMIRYNDKTNFARAK